MKTHPIDPALVAALAALQALRPLLVALAALVLTLAGYRPRQGRPEGPAAQGDRPQGTHAAPGPSDAFRAPPGRPCRP